MAQCVNRNLDAISSTIRKSEDAKFEVPTLAERYENREILMPGNISGLRDGAQFYVPGCL